MEQFTKPIFDKIYRFLNIIILCILYVLYLYSLSTQNGFSSNTMKYNLNLTHLFHYSDLLNKEIGTKTSTYYYTIHQ